MHTNQNHLMQQPNKQALNESVKVLFPATEEGFERNRALVVRHIVQIFEKLSLTPEEAKQRFSENFMSNRNLAQLLDKLQKAKQAVQTDDPTMQRFQEAILEIHKSSQTFLLGVGEQLSSYLSPSTIQEFESYNLALSEFSERQ